MVRPIPKMKSKDLEIVVENLEEIWKRLEKLEELVLSSVSVDNNVQKVDSESTPCSMKKGIAWTITLPKSPKTSSSTHISSGSCEEKNFGDLEKSGAVTTLQFPLESIGDVTKGEREGDRVD